MLKGISYFADNADIFISFPGDFACCGLKLLSLRFLCRKKIFQ